MGLRNLGRSGLRVSVIGLGCNNFGGRIGFEESRAVIYKALGEGITLFDTADTYGKRGGSEDCLGRALGDRRKQIVLATKFGMPPDDVGIKKGASRRYIMSKVEDSLRRLRTDWIDLYQVHQPDLLTPIEETLSPLAALVRSGKVRYIGCSNFPAWQVVEAVHTSRAEGLSAFISCQDEYSLLVRRIEQGLMPAAEKCGLAVLPYFLPASGLLTGKYRRNAPMPAQSRLTTTQRLADRYLTARNWSITEKLADFASGRGRSLVELAFGRLLSRTPVSNLIAGATRPEQVVQNARSAA